MRRGAQRSARQETPHLPIGAIVMHKTHHVDRAKTDPTHATAVVVARTGIDSYRVANTGGVLKTPIHRCVYGYPEHRMDGLNVVEQVQMPHTPS